MSILHKRHPHTIDPQGIWVMRIGAAEILGISHGAMLLLQRDRKFLPDCRACGRIRWKVAECYEKREELREYLRNTYPKDISELILTEK